MRIVATKVAYAFLVQYFENTAIVAYVGLRVNCVLKKLLRVQESYSWVQESYSRDSYEACRATFNWGIASMKLEMSGTVCISFVLMCLVYQEFLFNKPFYLASWVKGMVSKSSNNGKPVKRKYCRKHRETSTAIYDKTN